MGSKEWQKFEKNKTIALNILFVPRNTKIIRVPCKSKYSNKRKKQLILLMITIGKKQHLAVTDISALFERMSSNHDGDFYCLNCFIVHIPQKINLKNMKKYAIIMIAIV